MALDGELLKRETATMPDGTERDYWWCPKCAEKPMSVLHCLHTSGQGSSHGWGGSTEYYCCYCDTHFILKWDTESKHIEDHGPYAKYKVRLYEAGPKDVCPKRTATSVTVLATP